MDSVKHFFVGVKGLIQRKDGKVLLLKPNLDKHPFFFGDWDIPGGRLLKHSDYESRLREKIEAETGMTDVFSTIPLGGGIVDGAIVDDAGVKVGLVLLLYLCRLGDKNKEVIIDHDNLEFVWVTPSEAASMLFQLPDDVREKIRELPLT